ncbi:hypothetical protein LINGRAHAP2_LOCUS10490 [Linum grandiflorum]
MSDQSQRRTTSRRTTTILGILGRLESKTGTVKNWNSLEGIWRAIDESVHNLSLGNPNGARSVPLESSENSLQLS